MTKLTEDMVVARSKGSDLHNVRKLNCWGSELTDVSVVRNLPNVEVLSLSVNNIKTLADFQHCPQLQELYIRKNSIGDINEILYLRNLPKLKSLWLADNPCANFEQYRQTVLRALPHLQKLDNMAVDSEEVQQAMVCGVPLPINDSPMASREEREMPRSSSIGESLRSEGGGSSMSDCSPPASERRYSQTTTPVRASHQESYGRSVDDGYDYEEDEQPVMRRTSYNQASDPERRISQMSQYSNDGSYPQTQQINFRASHVSFQTPQDYSASIEDYPYSGTSTKPLSDPYSGTSTKPLSDPYSVTSTKPMPDPYSGTSTKPLPDPYSGTSTKQLPDPYSGTSTKILPDLYSGTSTKPLPDLYSGTSTKPLPDLYSCASTKAMPDLYSGTSTKPLPGLQQVSSGYGTNSSSSNGYYRESDASDRLRRTSYSSTQSPTRRSSQIVAEADSSADSRGYIRNHTSEYDTRNANYLSREDNMASRRTSQEQYRDQQRWCDGDERERAYSRGDGYGYASPPEVRQSPVGYEQRAHVSDPRYEQQTQPRASENSVAMQQHYESAHRRAEQQMQNAPPPPVERTSPTKPYPARPKTRNANLLSAVLCLVKELDYSSLEVVEMAVRCRMEELDD